MIEGLEQIMKEVETYETNFFYIYNSNIDHKKELLAHTYKAYNSLTKNYNIKRLKSQQIDKLYFRYMTPYPDNIVNRFVIY